MAVVRESGAFDEDGYVEANRAAIRRTDPLVHFVTEGWRHLRAPSLDFDLWWYTCTYLDPTVDDVNPFLHYLLLGRHVGFEPVPGPAPARAPTAYPDGHTPRRACLFAGYDRDGIVDDYVVDYLRELARHADVFYLADGVLEPGELDKLGGITMGAWSVPHAAYDFGSWSLLARDLVGWERIDSYDEVILANDSCFLVRPLDDVLAELDARACDWWGLQATSMDFNEDVVGVDASMPLDEARAQLIGPRRWSDVRYLHLSSYFMVLRRPVLDDAGFRFRLDTVCGQLSKQLVVEKYEIGIGRYLMDAGYAFETLGRRALSLPPDVLAAHLRPRRRRLPAGQAQLPRREPPRHPRLRGLARVADRCRSRCVARPHPGQHRQGLAGRPRTPQRADQRRRDDRRAAPAQARLAGVRLPPA